MKHIRILFFILLSLVSFPALAFNGEVIKIIDGDTIVVKDENNMNHKVRLAYIDAPELHQPKGLDSKNNLQKLLKNKNIEVVGDIKDRYGRIIAVVIVDSVNINEQQIRDGYAWVYRQYLKPNQYYLIELENIAQNNKRGLWEDSNPIPPWIWRKG